MVAYYILSYLTPFCLNDDLVYKFIWPYDNDSFTTPIKTIKDVIESLIPQHFDLTLFISS